MGLRPLVMLAKTKIAILISGRGSNMRSLVDAAARADFPAEIVAVISNKADAAGLVFAQQSGIATAVIDHKLYKNREAFEEALDAMLRGFGVEVVCLAGFMRLLTPWLIGRWENRILNIHPSILPDFPGLHTHERALEAGVSQHGCTVHLVIPEMDAGPILAQARVPVLSNDTPDILGARVLEAEHKLYPFALELYLKHAALYV
jgi:phosphoribosylglycinamide formyltransferase 1